MRKYALIKDSKIVATFHILACAEIFQHIIRDSYIQEYETDRNIRITND